MTAHRLTILLTTAMLTATLANGCKRAAPTPPADAPVKPEAIVPPAQAETAPAAATEAPAAPAAAEAAAAGKGAWMTDFDAAKAVAAKDGKDMLVDFSGSDWCGWCIKLDKEVFSKPEFVAAASKDFVLVVLDFPRKPENRAKIPEAQQKRNEELQEQFGVKGFPTVYLTDAAGVPYAQTGYRAGGPEPYLQELARLREAKVKKAALSARLAAAQGVEKAKLLDEIIALTPEDLAAKHHQADMEEIVRLDADNAAGLKAKYELKLRRARAQAAMDAGDFKKAVETFEAMIAELKPTGQDLQDIWVEAGAPYYFLKDMAKVRECLDNALKAAPQGEKVEQINGMIRRLFPKETESPK